MTVGRVWAGLQCIDYGVTYLARYATLSEEGLQRAVRVNQNIDRIGSVLSLPGLARWAVCSIDVSGVKKIVWHSIDGLNRLTDLFGVFFYAKMAIGVHYNSRCLNVIYYATSLLLETEPLREGWQQFSGLEGPSDAKRALLCLSKALVSVVISIFSLMLLYQAQGILNSQLFLAGSLLHLNALWAFLKVVDPL